MQIDDRIKQAQRKGAGLYVLGALASVLVIASVFSWLFLVRAYVIIVGPSEASGIASINSVSGMQWITDNKVYTLGGAVEVKVAADTFESATVNIDADSPSNIEVVLQPSPALLKASLDVAGDTSWYIDGQLVFVGNQLEYSLPADNYVVAVQNPYYELWETQIEANRAQTITLAPELVAISGSITLNSTPSGAQVSIDGQQVGQTPYTSERLGGQYDVQLTRAGYQALQDTLEVTLAAAQVTRNYQLIPEQAIVTLNATPANGVLLIDNIEKPLGEHSLDANTQHRFSYQLAGYYPYQRALTFAPGASQSISIVLEPELGKVNVASNVTAQVSINNQAKGNVPLSLELPAKETQITLALDGYRSVTKRFTPSSSQLTSLNIPMLTEFDARRQEGRPLFANQIGIDLQKFRGDAFTMGSPPNESERRRNEHEIDVDFSREFWVSRHEITQAQYAAFKGQSSNSKLPQTDISWNDAALFTNWLSQQEGLPAFYRVRGEQVVGINPDSRGYRLPTEAEWEWLAKKSKRPRSTVYVWGNQTRIPRNNGNYGDQSIKGTQLIFLDDYNDQKAGVAEVGSFTADRSGMYDLAGNVSEWVHDFYVTALPDTSKVHIDYLGAPRGTQNVVKGGNYTSGRLRELRAAFREVGETPKPTIGFRIARYD
jgi:formylglycine-generating enzyme required for sulfatase activity